MSLWATFLKLDKEILINFCHYYEIDAADCFAKIDYAKAIVGEGYKWSHYTTEKTRILNVHKHQLSKSDFLKFEKEGHCEDGNYEKCKAMKRFVNALQFYSSLDIQNKEADKERFLKFVNDEYTNAVNDNFHVFRPHFCQLEDIELFLDVESKKCPADKCNFLTRHYKQTKTTNDVNINFFIDMFDSWHCWLFHSFDTGFRVRKKKIEKKGDDEQKVNNESDENELFDAHFAKICKIIRKTDVATARFERISGATSKYTLATTEQGHTTFLDELYKHLMSESIDIRALQKEVHSEDYDSDSIKTDALFYDNVSKTVGNEQCMASIRLFVKAISVQSSVFSVGIRFYYWDYYKKLSQLPAKEQMVLYLDNRHDHGGHKVSELFVKKKYDTLKEEAMQYPNLTKEEFEAAKTKTAILMKDKVVKAMAARKTGPNYDDTTFLHYGINVGAPVLFDHILCLILYTDFGKLCTAMSATFRQIHAFETLKSVKKRNSAYHWFSKKLRELVELFGKNSREDKDKNETGFYFTGMTVELNVNSFVMRLNSPTSTSQTIEVALSFSKGRGAIFTFNNPSNDPQYFYLRIFDCRAFSQFKSEDERLFFGGFYPTRVFTVRIVQTGENYQAYFSAIFEFDKALNGNVPKKVKNGYYIVDKLIQAKLGKRNDVTVPQYIKNSFQLFCANKKRISLNLPDLYENESNKKGDQNISNLLVYRLERRNNKNEIKRKDDDTTNLVISELVFSIFPNCQSLIIDTTCAWNSFSFSFSLVALFDVIDCNARNLKEIIIKSTEYGGHCWVRDVWASDEKILKKEYAKKGFTIAMEIIADIAQFAGGAPLVRYNLNIHKQ